MDNSNTTIRMLMKTWDSKISLRISLTEGDVSCPTSCPTCPLPRPLLVMSPRFGFLQTLAARAFQCFQRALVTRNEYTPYFVYKGLPLPWQIPLGTLYDLVADGESPWHLTVRFPATLPSKESSLLPWIRSKDERNFDLGPLRKVLFSSLKEAAFICRGVDGVDSVNMMQVEKRDALWESIVKVDWMGYNNWVQSMDMNPLNRRVQEVPPRIPVRIFHRKGRSVSNWSEDVKSMSRPITVQDDGLSPTLGEILNELFPELVFEEEDNSNGGSGGLVGDLMRSTELSDNGDCDPSTSDQVSPHSVATVCGVQPPLVTPMTWLHFNMHAPDFFLYIVVKARDTTDRGGLVSLDSSDGC